MLLLLLLLLPVPSGTATTTTFLTVTLALAAASTFPKACSEVGIRRGVLLLLLVVLIGFSDA